MLGLQHPFLKTYEFEFAGALALQKFCMIPSVTEEVHDTFHDLDSEESPHFSEVCPEWFHKPYLLDDKTNGSKAKLMFIPISFPLPIGYYWTKFPLLMRHPRNWDFVKTRRIDLTKLMKIEQSKRRKKVKALKA